MLLKFSSSKNIHALLYNSAANRRWLVRSPTWPIIFPWIVDSHCNRIHSFLTTVDCFENGYVGKQPVAWRENCEEHWLQKLQESMDRCTGRCNITEIMLKTALNTIQSINQLKISLYTPPT